MRERLLFIYNPNAGKAKLKGKLSDIVVEFSENGYEVIVMPTAKRGDAAEFAKEYAEEGACSRIVCAGGDGTLNEVVSGVMKSGVRVPIGYIPAGTTNDFGYSLKIPKDALEAAKFAALNDPLPSDVGEICGNTFVYTAAFGLFSDVSYDTSQDMKNILGRVAYLLRGVRSLVEVQNYWLEVEYLEAGDDMDAGEEEESRTEGELSAERDTQEVENVAPGAEKPPHAGIWRQITGEFICGMVANSNSVGGFKGIMGKGVRFDDGVFEMLLIRRPHNVIELTDIVNELISKKLKSDNIVYAHVREVRLEAKSGLPWSLDGEFGGDMPQATIHIRQQAVDYIRKESD
ncbi:MAG: diacylglycerol kinase family lipid kinase [Lachnospiraceae bacterium]|nr:diacylglycerol kinase family lipid kinase [Lachnospiraceae bacterium]